MRLSAVLLALRYAVRARPPRDDRGDVPGWVMITVMTAALVVALLTIATPALREAFTKAIDKVTGAG